MGVLAVVLVLSAALVAMLVGLGPLLVRSYGPRLTPDTLLRLELLVIAALIAVLALLVGQGARASFVATASTEALTVRIRPTDPRLRWPRPSHVSEVGGHLAAGCATAAFRFGGEGPRLTVVRFSVLGPKLNRSELPSAQEDALLHLAYDRPNSGIRVVLDGDGESVGVLTCADGRERPAPSRLRLEFEPALGESAPTLPIAGLITIGGSAADSAESDPARATPILLSGTLTVEAESWPFKSGRSRTEAPLQLGDVVSFKTNDAPAPATGIVRAENTALAVVAYADAERALVARRNLLNQVPVAYGPTLWARIQAMNEWNALILLGGLVLATIGALRRRLETPHRPAAQAPSENEADDLPLPTT